ncbi:Eco57I restriction-modification methylase domain-containing protein [Actinomyces minihominis]|uniref:Eco57I restriction-modification methylase domain-containing protein n=1 Tax=Actinomyces minihominis TaxID=2002838 RepID=UPI000C06DD97|nr:Eco57I restriction-modification methylase domain-containing protein [Actinomyces minihominis]
MTSKIENQSVLDRIIVGRVKPHIYAFATNTVPNYLKVGDTYRPVPVRLAEWRKVFENLEHFENLDEVFRGSASINDDVYFRDHSVHHYIEYDRGRPRLTESAAHERHLPYLSREFFQDATRDDVAAAIESIRAAYEESPGKYTFYDATTKLPETQTYVRGPIWDLRPNQADAVDAFKVAVARGRRNLLMYAVMRFGKSFTSLCCAKAIDSKLVVIVSAKADVRSEWKKTVEVAGNFEGYHFLDSDALLRNTSAIEDTTGNGGTAVVFLTLQDLQGKAVKDKHRQLFERTADLLIVDETHFGARAEEYGRVLSKKDAKANERLLAKASKHDKDIDLQDADSEIQKALNARVRLHLSGTPYRILMGEEFEPEDIVSFVQFTDIVADQQRWDQHNLTDVAHEQNEWDNPYFGFPEMVRFAFNPNESSRKKMEALRASGTAYGLSALLKPKSITKDDKGAYKQFEHEAEVLDLLRVIDGSKADDSVLGFLNYDKIKEGDMCRHLVVVLPFCASCDAMERLIESNRDEFLNLSDYKIINISGVDGGTSYKTPEDVKAAIRKAEEEDQKTITLTVNRMLTGSTVEQWDTMLFLKGTASPQEYDQAIFRLQNQYTRELEAADGSTIRENLKPQTLLVDFDPSRMFRMQERKSLIYNANTEKNGNTRLKERIADELRISPIITLNAGRIHQVEPSDILEAVAEYNNKRSIEDEARDIPIDLALLADAEILATIERQAEIGSRLGLEVEPAKGEGDDLDTGDSSAEDDDGKSKPEDKPDPSEDPTDGNTMVLQKKLQTYYQRLLFFALLNPQPVASLSDITEAIEASDGRLARNLDLEPSVLRRMLDAFDPFKLSGLDYKIQNISTLANDAELQPLERAQRALGKFSRISDSEVRTPEWLCDEMIAALPAEQLKQSLLNGEKLLDIASKSGEFAVAAYKRLAGEMGLDANLVRDSIYSIPTSSIAYEFTRRFYEILGLKTENIAEAYNSYDLLGIQSEDGEDKYVGAASYLENWTNAQQSIPDEEAAHVKFGAVVGNPPYHQDDGGAGSSARPIYQKFVGIASALDPRVSSFVIPARWYTGGKGKELAEFRETMLDDGHISALHDFLSPEAVFPGTNNRGGICYFVRDTSYNALDEGGTEVTSRVGTGTANVATRPLNAFGLGVFLRDTRGVGIVEKVLNMSDRGTLESHVSAAKAFGFRTFFIKDARFRSSAKGLRDAVRCFGRAGKIGYVERDEVASHRGWIDEWKVFVPESNNIGTELNDDNQNTLLGQPGEICTETYLVVGADMSLTEDTANHLAAYLKTRFARFLHSQAKASQHGTKQTYRFVPLVDFSDDSRIDWNADLADVDQQLFDLYGLTTAEQEHIKASIKNMS